MLAISASQALVPTPPSSFRQVENPLGVNGEGADVAHSITSPLGVAGRMEMGRNVRAGEHLKT